MKRVRTVLQNTVIGKEAERQNLRGKRNRVGPYTNVTSAKCQLLRSLIFTGNAHYFYQVLCSTMVFILGLGYPQNFFDFQTLYKTYMRSAYQFLCTSENVIKKLFFPPNFWHKIVIIFCWVQSIGMISFRVRAIDFFRI